VCRSTWDDDCYPMLPFFEMNSWRMNFASFKKQLLCTKLNALIV